VRNFTGDCSGATAIEYALIASLISVMIVAASTQVGATLATFFMSVAGAL
jgi:pilus assembly protein Flp/PilA